MSGRTVRVGTRGSRLALAQAEIVAHAVRQLGAGVEMVTIETEGDRRAPDTAWGEGAFVGALEQALLAGSIDVAVHSAKDLPTDEDDLLLIAAYLPRADPRDALVGPEQERISLEALPVGARVGTDSPRRTGFLLAARPDLRLHPLNGNVDTRLRRLDEGESDALVLAVAGLQRLDLGDRIDQVLDPAQVPPAPGQGAICLQARRDAVDLLQLLSALDDGATRSAVEAERAFLRAAGGGCRAPVGALAEIRDDELLLRGGFALPDGSATVSAEVRGRVADRQGLGRELATILGDRLVLNSAARAVGAADSAPGRPRVVVTRAAQQRGGLMRALEDRGLDPVSVPAIEIAPVAPRDELDEAARSIEGYSWVVLTSANAAEALIHALAGTSVPVAGQRWAAVGVATSSVLASNGIAVDLQPVHSNAAALAAALPVGEGDRVLWPRGDLARDELAAILRERGAAVDEVIAYRTIEAPGTSVPLLRACLATGQPDALLFTSGSTVRGLLRLAGALTVDRPAHASVDHPVEALLDVTAVCIGGETGRVARANGFRHVLEAPMQVAEGLADTVAALLEDRTTRQPPAVTAGVEP